MQVNCFCVLRPRTSRPLAGIKVRRLRAILALYGCLRTGTQLNQWLRSSFACRRFRYRTASICQTVRHPSALLRVDCQLDNRKPKANMIKINFDSRYRHLEFFVCWSHTGMGLQFDLNDDTRVGQVKLKLSVHET